jgi:signal transduction histidine kinase
VEEDVSIFPEPSLVWAARDADESSGGVRAALGSLARLNVVAGATACLIEWRNSQRGGVLHVPAGPRWNAALSAILAKATRQIIEESVTSRESVRFASSELGPLLGDSIVRDGSRVSGVVTTNAIDAARVRVVTVAPDGVAQSGLEAVNELVARNALSSVIADEHSASRDFWRKRALATHGELAKMKAELAANESQVRKLEDAIRSALRVKPGRRFAGLGSLFANMGQFRAWMVAATEDGELRLAAASTALASLPPLDAQSALADSFKRRATILRAVNRNRAGVYREDRLFERFSSYVCVPFHEGAVALASNSVIDDTVVAGVKALAARIDPIIDCWKMEAENERLRRLVRSLGLRMFGAIDTERARIARDLHDHQAQLLAAARLALEADPDEARGVFKQLEQALRLRMRELRPATLGRSSLSEALRYELRRLGDTGVKGRLAHADLMDALTRPVQQLCYQVAREALSNVIRHSGASRVEISVEKRGSRVRLSILDNGKGIAKSSSGMGLSGLVERLELMGGRFRIESRPGSTRLVADIPEPA